MFDDLVGTERRKTNRRFTVALAAALHAGAIALAILWTQQPPEPVDAGPKGPITIKYYPPALGVPDKPPGPAALAVKPPKTNRGNRPPVKHPDRPIRLSHEPVAPTIQIDAPPEKPVEAAPEGPSQVTTGEPGTGGAPSQAGPGGGGSPDGEPGSKGGVASVLPGPRRYEDVVTLAPGVDRPVPSASCRPPAPRMPDAARLAGITGRVLVQFTVHSDGQVGEIRSLDPATPRVLVQAVAEWLQGCPFQPGLVSGRPVAVKMSQPFNFRMQ